MLTAYFDRMIFPRTRSLYCAVLACVMLITACSGGGGGSSSGSSSSTTLYLASSPMEGDNFVVMLTNADATSTITSLCILDGSGNVTNVDKVLYAGTDQSGVTSSLLFTYGMDNIPVSMYDTRSGATAYFSDYSNGVAHVKIVGADGSVVSEQEINVDAEKFTMFQKIISDPSIGTRSNWAAKNALSPLRISSSFHERGVQLVGGTAAMALGGVAALAATGELAIGMAAAGVVSSAVSTACSAGDITGGVCGAADSISSALDGYSVAACVAKVGIGSDSGKCLIDEALNAIANRLEDYEGGNPNVISFMGTGTWTMIVASDPVSCTSSIPTPVRAEINVDSHLTGEIDLCVYELFWAGACDLGLLGEVCAKGSVKGGRSVVNFGGTYMSNGVITTYDGTKHLEGHTNFHRGVIGITLEFDIPQVNPTLAPGP